MRAAFRYSTTASPNLSCSTNRSPRSTCRAFLASGDRAHPASVASTARVTSARLATVHRRARTASYLLFPAGTHSGFFWLGSPSAAPRTSNHREVSLVPRVEQEASLDEVPDDIASVVLWRAVG